MALELRHDLQQLGVGLGVDPLELLQRDGVADAGHDVLALGVLQVVTVDPLLAAARVAGERDPGARVRPEVAEDHRDDVDGGAEVGGDPLLAPVQDRAVGVPGVEHRLDGHVHLLPRLLREILAGLRLDDLLERVDERPHVVGVEVEIVRAALGLLCRVDGLLEIVTLDAEHSLAEHLDQPPV